MGGRAVGLASALILCSSGLFVGEMRQAGNDGPLAFFTTLALYAAWRVLDDEEPAEAPAPVGAWRRLFYAALGLGFLCKGPIVLMLTFAAIVPYLIQAGRLRTGPATAGRRAGPADLRRDRRELAGLRRLARPERDGRLADGDVGEDRPARDAGASPVFVCWRGTGRT